jgi:hypothetical protein
VSLSTALPCCSGGGEAISAACVVKTKISLYSLHLYSDRSERERERKIGNSWCRRRYCTTTRPAKHWAWKSFTGGDNYLGTANNRVLSEHESEYGHQPWTITSKEAVKDIEADPESEPGESCRASSSLLNKHNFTLSRTLVFAWHLQWGIRPPWVGERRIETPLDMITKSLR